MQFVMWILGPTIRYMLFVLWISGPTLRCMQTSLWISGPTLIRYIHSTYFQCCHLSDRYVLLGNHRDAWVFGALDPSSGTAAMLELSRAMAKMVKEGYNQFPFSRAEITHFFII